MQSYKKFRDLVKCEFSKFSSFSVDESSLKELKSDRKTSFHIPDYEFQELIQLDSLSDWKKIFAVHDHVFVNLAYILILNRPADSNGMNHYLGLLRSGKVDKLELLARIYFSKEARHVDLPSRGKIFSLHMWAGLIKQMPILGALVKWVVAFVKLPSLQKQINENHSHSVTLHVHLQQYLREAFSQITSGQEHIIESLCEVKRLASSLESYFYSEIDNINAEKSVIKNKVNSLAKSINETRKDMLVERNRVEQFFSYSYSKSDTEACSVPDDFYSSFENKFRGAEGDIIERLEAYLPILENHSRLKSYQTLDLACGRGEWLRLMESKGYKAVGIDINEVTNTECRAKGLNVIQSDILEYIRGTEDNSIGVVSAFHIVEHLPFPQVFELVEQAYRVLAPGGILIIETPNPANLLVGANSFYMDPTHRNPLPSPLIDFLATYHGFESEVKGLHPHPQHSRFSGFEGAALLNDLLFGNQDFAIIGRKK